MIRLFDVAKFYHIAGMRRFVFDGLTIDLPTNRRLALFGLPGSGKSTLIRLLAGLEPPDEGTIERFARLSFPVGYLRAMKAKLSPRQNLTFASRIYGADVDEIMEFVERVTEFGDLMDEPLVRLPVRERQSFACALSYAIPFDTYLIDGIFAGGSPEFRIKCQAMLEARAATRGLIFATSQKTIALKICDCGAVLHDGQITLYDDVREAVNEYERLEREVAVTSEMSKLDDDYEARAVEASN